MGQSTQRRWEDEGVAFGGGVVLTLHLINQWYLSLRVLDAELRMGHEIMDGTARLGRLQTFVGRHAVSEGVHNTNLKEEGKQSAQGLMEEAEGC